MRLHRFIGDFDLTKPSIEVTDSGLVSQWRSVLRLEKGDTVILSDGKGHEADAVITEIGRSAATVVLDTVRTPRLEPKKEAALYSALLKRENFELAVQKATEIGISRIVPLVTERTVKTGFNRERLEKIIREACEQSGRTTVPSLSDPLAFKDAVLSVTPSEAILFDLTGDPSASAHLERHTSAFIGPEGGFSDAEVTFAKDAGLAIGLMGTLTMRGETAAIVASYLLTR